MSSTLHRCELELIVLFTAAAERESLVAVQARGYLLIRCELRLECLPEV